MSTDYGNFHNFCRDSTLPVCNLFSEAFDKGGPGYYTNGGCELTGIPLSGGRHLRNLGTSPSTHCRTPIRQDSSANCVLPPGVILLDGIAILTTFILLYLSQRKRAAVGRREMQLFLLGYLILSICEIFTIGGFPLNNTVRIAFTGAHLGIITATTWMLMLNGVVGYQILNDGSFLSVLLVFGSAAVLLIGTGYIALDTGYDWSGYFNTAQIQQDPNRSYALYTLYLLAPAVFIFVYGCLETWLVLKVLGEIKPMRMCSPPPPAIPVKHVRLMTSLTTSLSLPSRSLLRHRPSLRLRDKRTHLQRR